MTRPKEHSNAERCKRAEDTIGFYDEGETIAVAMIDLFTDMRHLAHAEGIDFETVLRVSKDHYQFERREELPVAPTDPIERARHK